MLPIMAFSLENIILDQSYIGNFRGIKIDTFKKKTDQIVKRNTITNKGNKWI